MDNIQDTQPNNFSRSEKPPRQKLNRGQKLYVIALLIGLPCLITNSILLRVIGAIMMFVACLYPMFWARDIKTDLEDKNKKLSIRLVDGIKSLTKLMEVAYDHIKNNTYKLDKTDGIIRKHTSELHQLGRAKPRMVERRIEVRESKEEFAEKTRIDRKAQSIEARINKIETIGTGVSNNVPSIKHNP